MVSPPTKHAAIYSAAGIGFVGYVTFTLVNSTMGYPYQLWFTDMMDAQYVRAYERPMLQLPEGVVSRNHYVENHDRMTPAGQALTIPYQADEALLKTGEWNYATYCAPCHNGDGLGMGPVTDNSNGKRRFQMPGLPLAGPTGVAKTRSDGYLYLTIRNGGALMPSYGWAMDDREMWSVVAYLRTLPDTAYVAPAPAGGSEEG